MSKWIVLIVAACLLAVSVSALEATGTVGGLRYAVYGPDWTWQERDLNIMIVIENTGSETVPGKARLELPLSEPVPFVTANPLFQDFELPPRTTARLAFTEIQASAQAPRGLHPLAIGISTLDGVAVIPYKVRTIRGALVSPSMWALLLPVLLTALWSGVVFLALRRMGGRGAWLEPGAPFAPQTGNAP